jgi:DNA-binding response OmpR family regulator
MDILVIDLDLNHAKALRRLFEAGGCPVQIACDAAEAIPSLRRFTFRTVLIAANLRSSTANSILRELYIQPRQVDSPMVCIMADRPEVTLLSAVRGDQTMDVVPASADAILAIVRTTRDSDVALVAGGAASLDLKHTMLQEGYPLIVIHDLDAAVRQVFDGTYPVVFLETEVPGLDADQFVVIRRLTTENLACLSNGLSGLNLRRIARPRDSADIAELLTELQKDMAHSSNPT